MNQVNIIGNITRDPETREVADTSVTNFSIAYNEKFKAKSGESKEKTTFVDIEAWGKKGEVIAQYLGKGRKIGITGALEQQTWEDKTSGEKRSKLIVKLLDFDFIDGAKEEGEGDSSPKAESKSSPKKKASQEDEDIF